MNEAMKRFLSLLICYCCPLCAIMSQTLCGKLIDEQENPLPYANIVLLSLPDSAFVTGTVSSEDGTFRLNATCDNRLIRISSIGYITLYKVCTGSDAGTLQLLPDAQMLGEVTVKADLPKVQLKGDAQVTTVGGTVLEQAGTGNDVLNKIPCVSAEEGAVNVFGSGEAEIYINGRKMRNAAELDQLASTDIRRVEVVRNPGARYDASVKAVVCIFTKKPQGEGFGFDNRFSTNYRYGWSVLDQFDFNYRHKGFDLSGMLYGSYTRNEDNKGIVQETFLEQTWRQESYLVSRNHAQNVEARLSLNYRFDDHHSVGLRYDFDRTPKDRWRIPALPTDVYQDGVLYERSVNGGRQDRPEYTHTANLYYNGQVQDWTIDFNADGLWGGTRTPQEMQEKITHADGSTEQQPVTSLSRADNRLYAAKLVLTHPLAGGELALGGEYTYSNRDNTFFNAEGILDDDDSRIRENAVSAFLEYNRTFGKLQAGAGVRYEHLVSDYYEQGRRIDEQSHTYDNVFPSVSLSLPVGQTQWQLSYSGGITRPSYYMLRSNVTYINRYTYEGGNPNLQPALSHRLSLGGAYKWVYLNVNYIHLSDGFLYHSGRYSEDNPTISLVRFINTRDADRLYATLTLAPTVGLWTPQFSAMLMQQRFAVDTPQGTRNFNNPTAAFTLYNHFSLPAGFSLNIDVRANTRGDSENTRILEPTWCMDAALQKSFLSDRLTLQLQGTDLFNSSQALTTLYSGNRLLAIDQESRRRVRLTVRYKFNATKSTYKGTGAGLEQRSRM